MSMTKNLIKALGEGKSLTSNQITSKFGILNPTRHINYIRNDYGYAIDTVTLQKKNGERKTVYRFSDMLSIALNSQNKTEQQHAVSKLFGKTFKLKSVSTF